MLKIWSMVSLSNIVLVEQAAMRMRMTHAWITETTTTEGRKCRRSGTKEEESHSGATTSAEMFAFPIQREAQ